MIKPRALKKGDTIGLVAPSSPANDPGLVDMVVNELSGMGFNVKVGESCLSSYGYLAGEDELRARDLSSMFADPEIDGIVCLRGGYGLTRIIDRLDYEAIAKNPKVFVGYSDITAIHIALNQMCRLVTFHGPVAAEIASGFDAFTRESLTKAVMCKEPQGELRNPEGEDIGCLVSGRACGRIAGGNLSLIAATMGTRYEIDTKGKLLLLEDIGEVPYRVDRMLSQLRLAGKFDDCSGVIIGDWNNCVPSGPNPSLSLTEIFNDIIVPCGKPTIVNFKAGHCSPKITVPLGAEAVLDADACLLTVKEGAVV